MNQHDVEKGGDTKVDEEKNPPPPSPPSGSASSEQQRGPLHWIGFKLELLFNFKNERNAQKSSDFRHDAMIWQLYLEEAERKADAKAKSWNTALDSLLIFAGLFAGVVSSFVIDARKDVQFNNEPRLLTDILAILQNESAGDALRIPSTAFIVSALWIMSLYTTIFSAIIGVLGKAWLAKYYVPATGRRGAKNAYERYKLDKQAIRWRLKEVLILVPLLVQIAAVLFLIGLIIQLYGDSTTMGVVLLCFCALGLVVYCFMTIFPLIIPASPFNTPLSELWEALFGEDQDGEDRSAYQTDIDNGLGDILYTKLIQSSNTLLVDQAIAEITLPAFKQSRITDLCKSTDAPKIIFTRCRQCATSRTSDTIQRDETLGNHLLALLSFTEHYEKELQGGSNRQGHMEYKTLDEVLRESLKPGNPLYRWNELPESVRSLLFALRTNVLILLHSRNLGSSRYINDAPRLNDGLPILSNSDLDANLSTPCDLDANELRDRPWEICFQEIDSTHRIHFTIAACRGLVTGQPHLRITSSFILSLCLAKATLKASKTSRTSEWANTIPRERVDNLASCYVSELYRATVESWNSMAADSLQDLLSEEAAPEEETARSQSGVISNLIISLIQQNYALRIHAIRMLKHLSTFASRRAELFCNPMTKSVRIIASLAVGCDDQRVREDGFVLLTELSRSDAMARFVRTALVDAIQSVFSKRDDQQRIAAIHFIEKLGDMRVEGPFVSVVHDSVPSLVEMTLNESDSERMRSSAAKLSQKLWEIGFTVVKSSVLRYLKKLIDSIKPSSGNVIINALIQLLKMKHFPPESARLFATFPWLTPSDFTQEVIPKLFRSLVKCALYSGNTTINGGAAQELMALIAQDCRFRDLPLDVQDWLKVASERPSYWRARFNAVRVVEIFAKRVTVTEELLRKLLASALRDPDEDVRETSLRTLSGLMQDGDIMKEFVGTIKDDIVSDSRESIISSEFYPPIIKQWVPFIVHITKHVSFPESIPFLARCFITWAEDGSDTKTIVTTFLTSKQFADDSATHEALKQLIPSDLRIELPNVDRAKCGWVGVLSVLHRMDPLQQLAKDALSPAGESMKTALNCLTDPTAKEDNGDGESSGDDSSEGSSEDDYLSESTVNAPLRRLLYEAGWRGRINWADSLSNLATIFHNDFPEASGIVLAMAIHDHDSDVRRATLKCLSSLAQIDAVRPKLMEGIVAEVDTLSQDSDWNVRFELVKLLAMFAVFEDCQLPEKVIAKMIDMALKDGDYDIRSESVNSLAVIVANKERYPGASQLALDTFETGIKDGNWKPRQSWLRFISPHLKDATSPYLTKLIDITIEDEDEDVRETGLEFMEQLLRHMDVKSRDSFASQVGKSVAAALKIQSIRVSVISVLVKVTLSASKTSMDQAPAGHGTWIQIIILLGRNGFQGVAKLIESACKEGSVDCFKELGALFQKAKLQEPVKTVLPRYIESALKPDATTSDDVRSEAVNLIGRLVGVGEDELHNDELELLGESNDATIASHLADIALKSDDRHLREKTLEILKFLFTNTTRFPEFVKPSLSKIVESCFRDPDLMRYRSNAIAVLRSLTEHSEPGECEQFKDIVSPSVPQLLKLALLVTDKDHEHLRKGSQDILLENLTAHPFETKLNRDVLFAIPPLIPVITSEGKRIVLQLAETLRLAGDTAASVVHALAPLLKNTSSFPRSIAIELLSRLYSAHSSSDPRLLQSAIPEVITLALDERDGSFEVRTTAIQLLVALFKAPKIEDDNETATTSIMSESISAVKQITPLATKFMGQLHNENLRSSIVELLSLMAKETAVRRVISLHIISLAVATEVDAVSLQGHTDLLARLISDDRFGDEPMDQVLVFLASAMVTRPQLKAYRFNVLTALWCRYGSKTITKSLKRNDLVDWFTFALFGRHARESEVTKWLERCGPKPMGNPTKNGEHVGKSEVKEDKASKPSAAPGHEQEEVCPAQPERSVHSIVPESADKQNIAHVDEPSVNRGLAPSIQHPSPQPKPATLSSKRSSVLSHAVHEEQAEDPQAWEDPASPRRSPSLW